MIGSTPTSSASAADPYNATMVNRNRGSTIACDRGKDPSGEPWESDHDEPGCANEDGELDSQRHYRERTLVNTNESHQQQQGGGVGDDRPGDSNRYGSIGNETGTLEHRIREQGVRCPTRGQQQCRQRAEPERAVDTKPQHHRGRKVSAPKRRAGLRFNRKSSGSSSSPAWNMR